MKHSNCIAAAVALSIVLPSFQVFAEAGSAKAEPTVDQLNLNSSTITGSKELPKVMNILPWKRAAAADGKPPKNSLLNEVLAPANRVEFRRELRYSNLMPVLPKDQDATR